MKTEAVTDRPERSTGELQRRFSPNHPLVRGGLIVGSGIVLGNLIGFVRVAITAYLLGTRSNADALAVALGPLDAFNGALINTMIFAFVPMLTLQAERDRYAFFVAARRLFISIFACMAAATALFAPLLIALFGPGLPAESANKAADLLRIVSLSTMTAGTAAIYSAWLYTKRRFGPTAFYQAFLNVFTIAGALLLWKFVGIYGFAIGYAMGSCAQLVLVYFASRSDLREARADAADMECRVPARDLLGKPGIFLAYAGLLALNMIVTRAYATHAGTGMAAAFDYCIRCVNVVIAYLVSPASNSLLPEIARLHVSGDERRAVKLVDRTVGFASIAAVAACAIGILVRTPIISLLFERGSFTAQSTEMVSGVFLGLAPCLIGYSLLELTARSLFALNRPMLPLIAAIAPVTVNVLVSGLLRHFAPQRFAQPEYLGVGASAGLLTGFVLLLVLAHWQRRMANTK
jgi:putative peptidoglycan lipid II flippase